MSSRNQLLRRGFFLEYVTLSWNVLGVIVLTYAALSAHSVALAGFGLDSFIEIGASLVVIWELRNINAQRQKVALRIIGVAFIFLAVYILLQSSIVFLTGSHPAHSQVGIAWTGLTCAVMFALAAGKAKTGQALNNVVLSTEGRVTLIDAYLAAAVLLGLALNALFGLWWADPLAGLVIVYYGFREGRAALSTSS
jgi:divalent metal cation (Fe/Co/Zn/Cd) transporter